MMTNIRIKAVSQYGNIKIEGNDSWINGESPEIKDFIKNTFKAGDLVHITLSSDNKIAMIERAETPDQKLETNDKEEVSIADVSFKELTLIRQNACRHAASMIDVLQRQGEFDTHPPATVKAVFFEFAGEVEKWILRKK